MSLHQHLSDPAFHERLSKCPCLMCGGKMMHPHAADTHHFIHGTLLNKRLDEVVLSLALMHPEVLHVLRHNDGTYTRFLGVVLHGGEEYPPNYPALVAMRDALPAAWRRVLSSIMDPILKAELAPWGSMESTIFDAQWHNYTHNNTRIHRYHMLFETLMHLFSKEEMLR